MYEQYFHNHNAPAVFFADDVRPVYVCVYISVGGGRVKKECLGGKKKQGWKGKSPDDGGVLPILEYHLLPSSLAQPSATFHPIAHPIKKRTMIVLAPSFQTSQPLAVTVACHLVTLPGAAISADVAYHLVFSMILSHAAVVLISIQGFS